MEILRIASILILLGTVSARYHDHSLPLPPPDELARSLEAWTVPEEDTVLTIERELEKELGLQHRAQIPVSTDEEDDLGEFPKLITSSAGQLPGYKPDDVHEDLTLT